MEGVERAVRALYHAAPGSREQQAANAWLLELEQAEEGLLVGLELASRLVLGGGASASEAGGDVSGPGARLGPSAAAGSLRGERCRCECKDADRDGKNHPDNVNSDGNNNNTHSNNGGTNVNNSRNGHNGNVASENGNAENRSRVENRQSCGPACTRQRQGEGLKVGGQSPAKYADDDDKVAFFASQLLLSKVRSQWSRVDLSQREKVYELMFDLIEGGLRGDTSPLIQSRFRLILASVCVRSILQRPKLLRNAVEKFMKPPVRDGFEFLRLIVEELELCWLFLNEEEKQATRSAMIDLRSLTLDLLDKAMVLYSANNLQEDVAKSAVQCLNSWTASVIISEVPSYSSSTTEFSGLGLSNIIDSNRNRNGNGSNSNQNHSSDSSNGSSSRKENQIVNLGIGLRQILARGASGHAIAEWIAHLINRCEPSSALFQHSITILVDTLSDQSYPSILTLQEDELEIYRWGVDLLADALLNAFDTVVQWRSTQPPADSDDLEAGYEDLAVDPMRLKWRGVCMGAAALCAQHLRCLLFFCEASRIRVVHILLYGVENPVDLPTLEACLDFWDVAGDGFHGCYSFMSEWRRRHPRGALVSKLPAILTREGSLELFSMLVTGFVSCTAASLRAQDGSAAGLRLRHRIFDTLINLCMCWPELEQRQVPVEMQGASPGNPAQQIHNSMNGEGLRARNAGDTFVRHVLLLLHSKLRSEGMDNSLRLQAIVKCLIAVSEAEDTLEYDDEDADDISSDGENGTGSGGLDDEDETQNYNEGNEGSSSVGQNSPNTYRSKTWDTTGPDATFRHQGDLTGSLSRPQGSSLIGQSSPNARGKPTRTVSSESCGSMGQMSPLEEDLAESVNGSMYTMDSRGRTYSVTTNHTAQRKAAAASLATLWIDLLTDLMEWSWRTSDASVRKAVCELLGEVTRIARTRSPSPINGQGPGSALCQAIGFLLSSVSVIAENTCLEAAQALLNLSKKAATKPWVLTELQTCQFVVSPVAANGKFCHEKQVKVLTGVEGLVLHFDEAEEVQHAFVVSPLTCAVVRESITNLAFRYVHLLRHSQDTEARINMLRGCLERQLGSSAQVLRAARSAPEDADLDELSRAVTSALLTFRHVLRALDTRETGKRGRQLVISAMIPIFQIVWPDIAAVCSRLIHLAQPQEKGDRVANPLTSTHPLGQQINNTSSGAYGRQSAIRLITVFTGLYDELAVCFGAAAAPFVPDMIEHMVASFAVSSEPSCLKPLSSLQLMTGRIWSDTDDSPDSITLTRAMSYMVRELTQLLIRAAPSTPSNKVNPALEPPVHVAVSDELLDGEIARYFFAICELIAKTRPEILLHTTVPLIGAGQGRQVTVWEVCTVAAVEVLDQGMQGLGFNIRQAQAVCNFITQAVQNASSSINERFVSLASAYKPFLLAAALHFLAGQADQRYMVRTNLVVDLLRVVLQTKASNFDAGRTLTIILTNSEHNKLPDLTKQAVYDRLEKLPSDPAARKAAVSDVALLLSGHMQPSAAGPWPPEPRINDHLRNEDQYVDVA